MKFATELKTNWPGSLLKLPLRKRRNSPPNLKEWRFLTQLKLSEKAAVVSPRPWGKFLSAPNKMPALPLVMLMVGMNCSFGPRVLARPRELGEIVVFGVKVMWMRLKPNIASLTTADVNT